MKRRNELLKATFNFIKRSLLKEPLRPKKYPTLSAQCGLTPFLIILREEQPCMQCAKGCVQAKSVAALKRIEKL